MKSWLLARSCCTTAPAAAFFWAAMLALIYAAGLLVRSLWPAVEPFGDTAVFLALGAACIINFGRNRTLHCGLTGPLFVIGAIAAAAIEAEAWQFDMRMVWGTVLLGVAAAFAIEWRTVGRRGEPRPVTARTRDTDRLDSEGHFRVDTRG
jgi:hypothetical protein